MLEDGAPGWNRTSDPQLRRLMLYPTELRARLEVNYLANEHAPILGFVPFYVPFEPPCQLKA